MPGPNFEWDPKKNASNLAKHGIDFDTAAEVFEDPDCRRVFSRIEGGEERFLALGMVWSYQGRFVLVVVHAYRDKKTNHSYHISAKGYREGAKAVWPTVRKKMARRGW